jgi:tRNA threonylcarbamoyladenosine biosynthesis protein TsaE
VQGLLSEFGISGGESPTFVLIKPYPLKKPIRRIREIVHIDAFRTTSLSDALSSGISDVLSSPGSVAVVEWADRIKNLIPQNSLWITFEHRSGNTREIKWQKK